MLYGMLNDPVLPVLKRALTDKEKQDLVAMLRKEIPPIMATPDGAPDWDKEGSRLFPTMNVLWGKVFSTYYQRPKLALQEMERMREERHRLEDERFDKALSEPEPVE